jgi:mono/diheme cytochrome c family protein
MNRRQQGKNLLLLITRYSLLATLLLLAMLRGFPVHAQNGATAPQKLNPYTGKAEAIAEGQQLYKKFNCYGCHGKVVVAWDRT